MYEQRTIRSEVPSASTVTIHDRFRGPDGIANGGYLAGRFGGVGPTRVILHHPARVNRPLQTIPTRDGLRLLDGATQIMSTEPCSIPYPIESIPSSMEIGSLPDPDLETHPFPGCFVCGPANERGLRIVFKRTDGGVAANFTIGAPGPDDPAAHVRIAGALDCSSGWAAYSPGEAGVLGTFEFAVLMDPDPDDQLTVVAEARQRTGRKRLARSSVFDSRGSIVGSASSTWIDIPMSQRSQLAMGLGRGKDRSGGSRP